MNSNAENLQKKFTSFEDFYIFYLSEHSHPVNRALHFIGTTLGILWFWGCIITDSMKFLPITLLFGYGFAWFGHFIIEKNKPASFKQPLFSFRGDFKMWFEILTFKRGFKD